MSAYDALAPIWDAWFPHIEDVDFYASLAQDADGPIVELAVGTGRVAIPVAKRTARHIVGIDSSPAMLEVARANAAAAGVEIELRESDMREFALDEPVGLVYCPARSLLHLPTWASRRRVFERVARSLRPGGRFAWNAFVFDHAFASRNEAEGWQNAAVRHRVTYAPFDNRLDMEVENGPTLSLWWVTRSEWEGLLDVAGLETEALYGWFDRRPFDESSREFVWVARKPG